MNIKIFLRITAATTIIIGLSFLLVPLWLVNFFLNENMTDGGIFVRFLGSSLIGYSFLNLYASMYDQLSLVEANPIGNFATLLIALGRPSAELSALLP